MAAYGRHTYMQLQQDITKQLALCLHKRETKCFPSLCCVQLQCGTVLETKMPGWGIPQVRMSGVTCHASSVLITYEASTH